MRMFRAIRLRLFQALCSHEFSSTTMRRISPECVECACSKCGKVHTAPYGLALPGKIVR